MSQVKTLAGLKAAPMPSVADTLRTLRALKATKGGPGKLKNIFKDLFDTVLDAGEEFGDVIHPGVSNGFKIAKKYRDKLEGLRATRSSPKQPINNTSHAQSLTRRENVVIGTQGTPNRQRPTRITRVNGKQHCIGTELIEMLPSTGFTPGQVIKSMPINPATMPCPRLKRAVRGYERVAISKLEIHLDSAAGSNALGQVAILRDLDPKDTWASGGPDVVRNAISHVNCQLHSMWQSSTIHVSNKSMLWVDSSNDPDAVRFDTFGTLVIVCTQAIPATTPVGTLYLSYDFILEEPAEQDSLTVGGSQAYFHSGPGNDSQWFSNDAKFSEYSTLPCSIVGPVAYSHSLRCDAVGAFFVHAVCRLDTGSAFWDKSKAPNVYLGFSEGVDQYAGAYGSCAPIAGGPNSDGSHSSGIWDTQADGTVNGKPGQLESSCLIYASQPWSVELFQSLASNTGWTGIDVFFIALDSLPFASLTALRRAKVLEKQTTNLANSVSLLASLRAPMTKAVATSEQKLTRVSTSQDAKEAKESPSASGSTSSVTSSKATSTSSNSVVYDRLDSYVLVKDHLSLPRLERRV